MSARIFVDTNVLVYAHDRTAGRKHERAREVVSRLWEERNGVVSTQVLQELYVNLRRVADSPPSLAEAGRILEDYLCWEVVVNDAKAILGALKIEEQFGLSFWDSLIVQAATAAGATLLYSEDLNQQEYGGVRVVDPFSAADLLPSTA